MWTPCIRSFLALSFEPRLPTRSGEIKRRERHKVRGSSNEDERWEGGTVCDARLRAWMLIRCPYQVYLLQKTYQAERERESET